jgi:hypothetical protein
VEMSSTIRDILGSGEDDEDVLSGGAGGGAGESEAGGCDGGFSAARVRCLDDVENAACRGAACPAMETR